MRFKRYARKLKRRLARPAEPSDRALRLHLGCGQDYWHGYINIDINPEADSDLRADFDDIGRLYVPASVSEVAMIHSLGYLRLWQARELFAAVYRLLVPGGKFTIELPDVEKCAHQLQASRGDLENYLEALRAFYAFDAEQIRRRERYPPYAFGWSAWHLKRELEQAGFIAVTLYPPRTHGERLWRDIRLEATK